MPPKVTPIHQITYRLIPARKLAGRIAQHYGLSFQQLLCTGGVRAPDRIARVRQLCHLALYDGLEVTTGQLSLLFAYKYQTGGYHCLRAARDRLQTDPAFRRDYHRTLAQLALKAA